MKPSTRILSMGSRLWREGEAATTIAIVDSGLLGVRSDTGRLIGVAPSGAVLGEASVLAIDGATAPRRAADVFAIDDGTMITEYPARFVRDAFGVGLHRQLLRALVAQIHLNLALATTSDAPRPLLELLNGLGAATGACERKIAQLESWEAFLLTFRHLIGLRDFLNSVRGDLAAVDALSQDGIARAVSNARSWLGSASGAGHFVERWLDAAARIAGATGEAPLPLVHVAPEPSALRIV